ncbi:receptor like protein 15 [Raphanus sativus]|nr:receptor like protein 15 [Raphanus sativus]
MERKLCLGQKLILVILLLGELHGYKSCIEKERKALLDLKKHVISQSFTRDPDFILTDWTNDTKSDCCRWDEIKCSRTSGRVINLSIVDLWFLEENSLLNLSLLHPFEEIQRLELSGYYGIGFSALFDDVEDFINLTNLEVLDLSGNRFNSSVSVLDSPHLKKLKALDLSGNELSNSMELQGICKLKNLQELDISHNKLSGQFPLCIASLTGLRALDLSSNQFTGKVPSALGNFRSIEYLSLVDNNFEGLFSFNSLTASRVGKFLETKISVECCRARILQFGGGSSFSLTPERPATC